MVCIQVILLDLAGDRASAELAIVVCRYLFLWVYDQPAAGETGGLFFKVSLSLKLSQDDSSADHSLAIDCYNADVCRNLYPASLPVSAMLAL